MEAYISKVKLRKIFGLSHSTIKNYTEEGILKPLNKEVGTHTYFKKDDICKILGLKNLPDEPFLTTKETLKILGLSDSYSTGNIRKYCNSHKIPYYIFKNQKGSHTYFIRSEVEKALEYTKEWGIEFPNFIMRNFFLREIFKIMSNRAFTKKINENQKIMLEEFFLNRKTITDISQSLNIKNHPTANTYFYNACKRVFYAMKSFDFNANRLEELAKENTKLISENRLLSESLKIYQDKEKKTDNPKIEKQSIDVLATSFSENVLPVRVIKLLERMEVKNLYELSKWKRSNVEKFRDAGKKTIDALENLLRENKLTWAEDPKVPKILKEKIMREKIENKLEKHISTLSKNIESLQSAISKLKK